MSFQKQETAVKTRDLLKKLVNQQVPNIVSTAKVGRVISVDLPRLQAMVWFPGDEQPMPVSLFASVIPGSWYSQFNVGDNSSTGGFGSMAVVESFRGVPYITEVLTGGQFAYNQKVQNLTIVGETTDQFGNGSESIININLSAGDLVTGEAAMFGPFFTNPNTGYPGGWIEVGVSFGRGSALYRLTMDSGDLYNSSGMEDLDRWFRLIPEHENRTDRFNEHTDFHLEVCWRETSAGLTQNNQQYREFWFRLINYTGSDESAAADISVRSSLLQNVGGLISRKIVVAIDTAPSMNKGYLGYHNSRYIPATVEIDGQAIRDRFDRIAANGWGTAVDTWSTTFPDGFLTWTNSGGANSNYDVDGGNANIRATAASTEYKVVTSNMANRTNHDIYGRFKGSLAAVGSYYEVLIPARYTAANNFYSFMVRVNTTNQMDVYLRKTVAGVTSTVGAIATNVATFTANTYYWVRCQVRGSEFRIKLWVASAVEPSAWHAERTDASITSFGSIGCGVLRNVGNTNSLLVVQWGEFSSYTNPDNTFADPNSTSWNSGPYRAPMLRVADALQKTWIPDGTFTWSGTHITWTGKLWFTGIGAHPNGLVEGLAGVSIPPTNWTIPVLGSSTGNTTAVATAAGIPLGAGQSLWCAIPPGIKELDLYSHLFIVDSPRNGVAHGIPEWAVFIAQRQPATAATGAIPIRLGNGDWLDKWHVIGSAGEPSFNSGWSNTSAGVYTRGAFRKISPDMVELSGLLTYSTTTSAGILVFALPVGYRPLTNIEILRATHPAAASTPVVRTIAIASGGNVTVTHFAAATNPGPIDLNGIQFSTTVP